MRRRPRSPDEPEFRFAQSGVGRPAGRIRLAAGAGRVSLAKLSEKLKKIRKTKKTKKIRKTK